ncbi:MULTISPECIES: DUF3088 domain-containing protein [unclassified Sphingomonas]|uniref:DUF3088 domain-containing protein n=1 Tax=unclassified Sphingomonas TaxID=196159 RepID=UPI0006F55613|nr:MULTISPECIES: DUF3088 domain-containing protein [unclassified Sphingomonas]KQM63125.1 hypothetical protein ASE65_17330 [Sphingomonas sp. Leaf16]KQN14984.1 hypothetical protein ASE81_17545 [Sphingomonas sp. Leaf29]KQN20498.1 hypothetical protein ASE83_17315 [Sphingomonas sp. Leaf32]
MSDKLFLMKPGFTNAGLGPFYCGDSVSVEGLLGFFPALRDMIAVTYIDFPRPRQAIIDLIGEANQSVPVLVLADDATIPPGMDVKMAEGRRFLDDERHIRQYLSARHALPTAG